MRIILFFWSVVLLTPVLNAQAPDTEIFLLSVEKSSDAIKVLSAKNISSNPGYDNQPSFTSEGKSILFTSARSGGGDTSIYEYVVASGKTNRITKSGANEYTGKELDKQTVTFVREGSDQTMSVFRYDRESGKESPALKNKEPVAYYAFNSKGDGLVWVRYAFMMHWVNPEKSINRFVANYAQPSVPHLIPGTDKFSFMVRHPDDSLWIKEFDPATQSVRPITTVRNNKKDYCWHPDKTILLGDGSSLYSFKEGQRTWSKIADLASFGIKDITRIAASPDGKLLAVVSNQ